MRVVFMGTPEFSVPSLKALCESKHEVVGVVSQPDKPKGRGMKLVPTPVKAAAMEYGVPVYQPTTLKTKEAVDNLAVLDPDIIIVVAYGKLLPNTVLELPKYGCVNLHASLLPAYRGAGPISWCILNGESKTGVTTMHMAEQLDAGDMILQEETPIGENETADELHDRLATLGAPLLLKTLDLLEEGNAPRIPQNDELSSYAPMLDKSLSPLDFSVSANEVHHKICGLSSWPCAQTTVNGKLLKVYSSRVVDGFSGTPGTLLSNKRMIVACKDGAVEFTSVQLAGGKRMAASAFLAGHPLSVGTELGS